MAVVLITDIVTVFTKNWWAHHGGSLMPDEEQGKSDKTLPKSPRDHILTSLTRNSWIDEVIRRAEAEGQFRDLPGAGKPLPQTNPYEALDEWAMAHHILKQSGFLPHWLQLRKEVAEEKPAVVAALEEYRRQRVVLDSSDPAPAKTLRRLADRYLTLAKTINQKIDEHNYLRPGAMSELVRLPEDEVERSE
jgi:hypothetical protein